MFIVYKKENGRLISIDLDGTENVLMDQAELYSREQAEELAEKHEAKIMDEQDWFSYC